MIFKNRKDAGEKLIPKLIQYKNKPGIVILALPRGGVVTAAEIVRKLNLPLDLVVPRKIGAPGNPEFAIGAIAEDGVGIFDNEIIAAYNIGQEYIKNEVEKEKKEAERRLKVYRGKRLPLNLEDKTVILVDDGVATGSTMRAAIRSVKKKKAKKIIVAIPTIAQDTLKKIQEEVDEVIYLKAPLFFGAVGAFYEDFAQTEDKEVIDIIRNLD